ncbi:MAG: hypothetical protein ACOZHQ_11620 [Thermodesulfobacteriota bacterium]
MNVGIDVVQNRVAFGQRRVQINLRMLIALVVVVTGAALLYAYTAWRAFDVSYEISRGLETQRELMETGLRLKVELGVLRAPERLEQEGARLGLAPARPEQTRSLP